MNQRIKELFLQAGFHPPVVKRMGDEYKFEKFAELIVRECINIACEYDKPKLSGPGHAIASYIESHFDIYIGEDGRFVK